MIIRSQDKRGIVNLSNIDMISAKRNEYNSLDIKETYETDIQCYNGTVETVMHLGTYSSEEKAIKVLDMIANKYAECEEGKAVRVSMRGDFIFQMPQDGEVN